MKTETTSPKEETTPKVEKSTTPQLLKKVGLDYSSFDAKEVALIIQGSIVDKAGIAKNRYIKLLNNFKGNIDFLEKMIKYNDKFTTKDCMDLSKELKVKFDAIKAGELEVLKKQREDIDKKIKDIEGIKTKDTEGK